MVANYWTKWWEFTGMGGGLGPESAVIDRLEQLAKNPRDLFTKSLTNAEGLRSTRVGTWRIVYCIDESLHEVQVSDIAPRGEVYRRL